MNNSPPWSDETFNRFLRLFHVFFFLLIDICIFHEMKNRTLKKKNAFTADTEKVVHFIGRKDKRANSRSSRNGNQRVWRPFHPFRLAPVPRFPADGDCV